VDLDLEAFRRDGATLWVDAVQLERGGRATPYRPRLALESFLMADASSVFDRAAGATLSLRAFDNTDGEWTVAGRLTVITRPSLSPRASRRVAWAEPSAC
jgi:hypothetical protein